MLSKQCGLLENSQAAVLLITSQLSLIFLPVYFQTLFLCLLTHLYISRESPTDPPVWAVTARLELAIPTGSQYGSPGQFQTQSTACLIFSTDKITSQATGKLTQTSSIRLTTESPQTLRNLQPKLIAPLWNTQGKINSSGKNTTSLEKT